MKGRNKLLENDEGERFKLKTSDGNTIDTVFVDKRNKRLVKIFLFFIILVQENLY